MPIIENAFNPAYFEPSLDLSAPVLNSPPPQMHFMAPPTPAPQPQVPSGQPFLNSTFAPASSGTQYAGITHDLGVQSDQAYLGQYASLEDYAKTTIVGAQAAGVGSALLRGDFSSALRQGAALAGSAYLNSGAMSNVGKDFVGSPPTFVDGTGAPIMSFGSPGQ